MFNIDKIIISGIDIHLNHPRAPVNFYSLTPSDDTKVLISILDDTHFITQVEFNPSSSCSRMKRKVHCAATHSLIKTFIDS